MNKGNRYSQIQNGIVNSIINDKTFINTKFGIITFSDTALVGDRNYIDNPKDVSMKGNISASNLLQPLFSLTDLNSKDGFRQLFQTNKIITSESNHRNINEALLLANDIYKCFGEENKNRAIIILTSGEMKYSVEAIKSNNEQQLNVITLDISDDKDNNIEKLHGQLGGNLNDYIIGTIDGGNYNSVAPDMAEVAKRLLSVNTKLSFDVINAKLHFDTNTNFDYISGSESERIKEIISDGEQLIVKLEDIVYQYKETVNGYDVYESDSFISYPLELRFLMEKEDS